MKFKRRGIATKTRKLGGLAEGGSATWAKREKGWSKLEWWEKIVAYMLREIDPTKSKTKFGRLLLTFRRPKGDNTLLVSTSVVNASPYFTERRPPKSAPSSG